MSHTRAKWRLLGATPGSDPEGVAASGEVVVVTIGAWATLTRSRQCAWAATLLAATLPNPITPPETGVRDNKIPTAMAVARAVILFAVVLQSKP